MRPEALVFFLKLERNNSKSQYVKLLAWPSPSAKKDIT